MRKSLCREERGLLCQVHGVVHDSFFWRTEQVIEGMADPLREGFSKQIAAPKKLATASA